MDIKKISTRFLAAGTFFVVIFVQLIFLVFGFTNTLSHFDYVLYIICIFCIIKYWSRMTSWIKGVLGGLGVWALGYSILMDLGGIIILKFIPYTAEGLNRYYSFVHMLLSPVNWFYLEFVAMKRVGFPETIKYSTTENVFLSIAFYLYPIVVGALVGLLVAKRNKTS